MKKVLGIITIVAVSTATSATFAFRGWGNHDGVKKWDRTELMEMREEHKAEMEEHKAEIEAIVVANDYQAFQEMMKEKREEKEMKREENGKEYNEEKEWSEEDIEEKMKGHFDSLVAYYNEHGNLEGMRGKDGFKKAKKKARKHYKESHKGLVKGMLTRMSDEKLEKTLDKIIEKLEKIEISNMEEERKEKIIDLLEGIAETINEHLAE